MNRIVAWTCAGAAAFFAAVAFAQYSGLPFRAQIDYLTALPATGAYPGQEVRVISGNPPTVVSWVWDSSDDDWERTDLKAGFEDNAVVNGTLTVDGGMVAATVTGAIVGNGAVTLGSNDADDITVNGPVTWNVFREDFDFVAAKYLEFDFTASVLTDAGHNIILMPTSQIGVISWVTESSDGLAAQPEGFAIRGELGLGSFADDVDNDAVELTFGAYSPVNTIGLQSAVWFDEDDNELAYCEASLTIADISELDDLWFGWVVDEDYDNPPASATFNTAAYYTISDAAGDVDIETVLNGGAIGNDDGVLVWADAATHVLRVTIGPDTVSFTRNGIASTQTAAVLNADATDRAVCRLGYTLVTGDATPEPGVVINYVEIGLSQ